LSAGAIFVGVVGKQTLMRVQRWGRLSRLSSRRHPGAWMPIGCCAQRSF